MDEIIFDVFWMYFWCVFLLIFVYFNYGFLSGCILYFVRKVFSLECWILKVDVILIFLEEDVVFVGDRI